MSTRYASVIVLAEDERSANLLRRYVERATRVNKRRIRQRISPSAAGDAKRWVIHRYPMEMRELRRMLARTCLLVHLDADTETVAQRCGQLDDALSNDGQVPREPSERVSFVVPRRHTETWLCVLTGIDVTEEQDCKRQRLPPEPDQAVKPAAEQLYQLTRANAPTPSLPSLAAAIMELRRLGG